MQDIAETIGRERVAAVVDHFYERIRQHPTLATPFAIVDDWPLHKEYLTHFWWVSLGGKRYLQYGYAVAQKHTEAGFTPALLVDWLTLFREVLVAELRAEKIGESLRYMHEFQSRDGDKPTRLYRPA